MPGINWDAMDNEERVAMYRFLEKEYERALKSYERNPDAEKIYCPYCNQLLIYNSISYWEGFHIDSCE